MVDNLNITQNEYLLIKNDEIDHFAKEIDNLKRVNDTERKEHQDLREEINDLRDKMWNMSIRRL